MQTENNSKPSGPRITEADVLLGTTLIGGFVALAIVAFIVMLVIYGMVFGLCAGAIYLGVKVGSHGQIGFKKPYEKIHDLNEQRMEHLSHLEGESEDLRQLAESHFEDQKLDLYRPKDEERPVINLDKAKEGAKKLVKTLFR